MLDQSRIGAALQAIHRVLIHARTLVGDRTDPEAVYRLLDRAELLPILVVSARSDSSTDEFRESLADLSTEFPDAVDILNDYDAGRSLAVPAGVGN